MTTTGFLRGRPRASVDLVTIKASRKARKRRTEREAMHVCSEVCVHISSADLDVLKYLAQGLMNKQIAVRMSVGEHSVKNRLYALCSKLGLHTRLDLVLLAVQQGWIHLPPKMRRYP